MPGRFSSFPGRNMTGAMERRMRTRKMTMKELEEEEEEREKKQKRRLGYNNSAISSTGSTNRRRSY